MRFSALLLPLTATLVFANPKSSRSTTSDKPTVTLDYTTLQAAAGNETLGYYKYQNIRFAAVPAGDLRFAKPQWPPTEAGVNNGTTYADADVDCSSEEDCLYMDVWAPANSKGKKLPVMVWTYGGGFTGGSNMPLFMMTRYGGHNSQLFNKAYITSPGFVPGAGHHQGEAFYQNVSTAVGCTGGDLTCMREVSFTNLTDAATEIYDTYGYQFQPRVDGDFVADTYESQLYQGRFNFDGPLIITHEQHENNGSPTSGVNTTADVEAELRAFFPAITDDVVEEIIEAFPASDYTSPGYRFADMKQSFDLTAHDYALTRALDNNTWNAMVALEQATHGTDQSYYWYSTYTLSSTSSSGSADSGAGVAISGSSSVSSTVAVCNLILIVGQNHD
ncbi:unnamed protein product [Penicillium salamii]|nr:unnamed protein product [Penicillium salamii]